MSLKKSLNEDKTYCKSIAKSISDIIRFSLDEEFRKKSFQMFGVSSTTETEREIRKRLMYIAQVGNTDIRIKEATSQNESENVSRLQDIKNLDAQSECQNITDTILTPSRSTDSNFQAAPENIFKRNWLQISSQQYREIIKKQKLNYYSQPQLGHRQQYNSEFLSCGDSQPSSLCSEGKISLSRSLDDITYYCREKFRDSLEHNVEKYFKKNLKSHNFNSKLNKKY